MSKKFTEMDAPIFDILVDTEINDTQQQSKRAEVQIGDPLFFRCVVNGEPASDHGLSWLHDGGQLVNGDEKLIETVAKPLTSTLKIARFEPTHKGQYECSVKDKSGIRKRAKIKIDIRQNNYTTLFNEELCPNLESYCKHGGTCLIHKQTKHLSCRCQPSYYGEKCQFLATDTSCPKAECQRTLVVVGCATALAIVSLFVCLLFIMRHKAKKQREKLEDGDSAIERTNADFTCYIPSPVTNGRPSFVVLNEEHSQLLGPEMAVCTKCGRQFNKAAAKRPSRISLPNQPKNSFSQIPKSASDLPVDPNCILCMVEAKTNSLPGYLKVSDVDGPRNGTSPLFVASLPKKTRHFGESEYEEDTLQLPKKSVSSPVSPVGSTRRIHETAHRNSKLFPVTDLEESPNRLNRNRTVSPKPKDAAVVVSQTAKSITDTTDEVIV